MQWVPVSEVLHEAPSMPTAEHLPASDALHLPSGADADAGRKNRVRTAVPSGGGEREGDAFAVVGLQPLDDRHRIARGRRTSRPLCRRPVSRMSSCAGQTVLVLTLHELCTHGSPGMVAVGTYRTPLRARAQNDDAHAHRRRTARLGDGASAMAHAAEIARQKRGARKGVHRLRTSVRAGRVALVPVALKLGVQFKIQRACRSRDRRTQRS